MCVAEFMSKRNTEPESWKVGGRLDSESSQNPADILIYELVSSLTETPNMGDEAQHVHRTHTSKLLISNVS